MASSVISEIVIQEGDRLFHGRAKTNCDPPIFRDGPFWTFREKDKAYLYGAKETHFLSVKMNEDRKKQLTDSCWNILTFKTRRTLRLIDLSPLETRLAVREHFKTIKWPDPSGYEDMDSLDQYRCMPEHSDMINGTCESLVDCLFPDDQPLLNKAFEKPQPPKNPDTYRRDSKSNLDMYFAEILFEVLPQYDGWYIGPMPNIDNESGVYPEEYMIWNPKDRIVLDKHETYDYRRISDIIERCLRLHKGFIHHRYPLAEISGTIQELPGCYNLVAKAFRENQLACLVNQKANEIHCYLLEELTNQAIVTEQQLTLIKTSLEKGESYIELI